MKPENFTTKAPKPIDFAAALQRKRTNAKNKPAPATPEQPSPTAPKSPTKN